MILSCLCPCLSYLLFVTQYYIIHRKTELFSWPVLRFKSLYGKYSTQVQLVQVYFIWKNTFNLIKINVKDKDRTGHRCQITITFLSYNKKSPINTMFTGLIHIIYYLKDS